MSLFSKLGGDATEFDTYDTVEPAHIPDPGAFLNAGTVLTGDAHRAFHRLTRELFEASGVYDMTFGYNLARLNLDPRHPDAGFRYALDPDEPNALRATFFPTTEFCPQSDTLSIAAFRAWNGRADRHEYDLVRVRVAPTHHRSDAINGELRTMTETFRRTGELPGDADP